MGNELDTMSYSVLLATYNGARYMEEFLESCLWSMNADVLVRDDGSQDETLEIIGKFTQKKNISCTVYTGERLGAKNNFAYLLSCLEKPYFFFADQDDIWEAHKIPTMLKAMQELEAKYGKEKPLLVFSDASLMNAQGEIFCNSFFTKSFIPKKWNEDFKNVLVMPFVPGCTMLGNKALAKAALPIAAEAAMHDGWLLQVANALGYARGIDEALIRYRQHDANTLGANVLTLNNVLKKVLNGRKPKYDAIVQTQKQAQALLKHCGSLMPQEKYELCKAWAEVTEKGWLARRVVYGKYGFRKAGWMHNAVLWMCG